jgi:hypothetical protein
MTSDINLRTHSDPAVVAAYAKRENWSRVKEGPDAESGRARRCSLSVSVADAQQGEDRRPLRAVGREHNGVEMPVLEPAQIGRVAMRIIKSVFRKGSGYPLDRKFGGLALSTPRTFAPQVQSVGLEVVDRVGGRYPDVQALWLKAVVLLRVPQTATGMIARC